MTNLKHKGSEKLKTKILKSIFQAKDQTATWEKSFSSPKRTVMKLYANKEKIQKSQRTDHKKNLLELIRNYSKVLGYKVSI